MTCKQRKEFHIVSCYCMLYYIIPMLPFYVWILNLVYSLPSFLFMSSFSQTVISESYLNLINFNEFNYITLQNSSQDFKSSVLQTDLASKYFHVVSVFSLREKTAMLSLRTVCVTLLCIYINNIGQIDMTVRIAQQVEECSANILRFIHSSA